MLRWLPSTGSTPQGQCGGNFLVCRYRFRWGVRGDVNEGVALTGDEYSAKRLVVLL